MKLQILAASLIAGLAMTLTTPSFAAAGGACAGRAHCEETRSFVADMSNFRVSKSGRYRVLTATINFRNKTGKPLVLGYVNDSGVALDERGNRYVVANPQAVRGMGVVTGSSFDPKFVLAPGEAADTRFELIWDPGREIVGVTYELDLAVREINEVAGNQYKLGVEHAVHFSQLAEGGTASAVATTAAPAAAAPAAAASAGAAPDPCGGSPRCYNAGAFTAEIAQLSATAMGSGVRHHSISINIRFRNVSNAPVVLGYKSGSSAAIDNFGNRYYWGRAGTHDTSVKGIGFVSGRTADTQFQLQPGQSRNATFNLIRFEARPPIGSAWGYDVVIDELEILPGQQVRTARENSLNFQSLTARAFASAAVPGLPVAAGALQTDAPPTDALPADAQEIANDVIGLFNKLKRK
ncbi:MAG: hypothetical protein KA756_10320 [Steroidobacteraceae bacterium]|nr:hypothetical protein [Steroidobacteraceae bacterium]